MIPQLFFIGTGTLINAAAVIACSFLGARAGHWIPSRTRGIMTPVLGLVVLVIGGFSTISLNDNSIKSQVGSSGMVIVLISLVIGTMIGSVGYALNTELVNLANGHTMSSLTDAKIPLPNLRQQSKKHHAASTLLSQEHLFFASARWEF